MSNSDYNKIVSAINSVSQDYTYSPPSNNLICIDSSNNRIGINTLEPRCSLHISGGDIIVNNIYAGYIDSAMFTTNLGGSISVTNVNASTINSTIVNVSNTLDISNGRIKANYVDISSILDISKGNLISKHISSTTIDISSTLDISKGNIISNKISSVNIDISSTLDISRGRIKVQTIDVSVINVTSLLDSSQGHIKGKTIDASAINVTSLLDISQARIKAKTIDASAIAVTSLLDISKARIKAQTIDVSVINVSSLLDSSQGRIKAQTIDVSSIAVSTLLDSSQGRIKAQTIDASAINVSSLLDISRGRIKAQIIDVSVINVSSLLDSSQGHIEANTIDASAINVSSLLDISHGRIKAQTLDASAITVSSLLDISRGTLLAHTISGSAITINANAVSSGNIVNIDMGSNFSGITISITNVNGNAININNINRVATTQHIKSAIPAGLIIAYYRSSPPPGWVLCDGFNNTPDLRGRFILGESYYSVGPPSLSPLLTPRTIGVSGGLETVGLTIYQIPQHTHGGLLSYVADSPAGVNEGRENVADYPATPHIYSSTTNPTGNNARHNNMPPYYVLTYIMKTNDYDFCYNLTVPTAPIILSVTNIGGSDYGATITWAPSNNGGSPIIKYDIYANGSLRTYALPPLTSKRITNMNYGTNSIKMNALNDIGPSLFSNSITIMIN